MHIGVVFPQAIGTDAGAIRAFAQATQDLGYSHLLAADGLLGADPAAHPGVASTFTIGRTYHEPFTLFGFVVAVAPKLALATWVVALPTRPTVLVAKQAAEVDLLTDGRFRLGVGIGRWPLLYDWVGADFRNRARRLEEQITLLRRLWQEPCVTFTGRYHRIASAGIAPLPVQRPIPIWIGASAEPALRRAAAMADGLFASPGHPPADGWAALLERLRGWVRAAGRDPTGFGVEAVVSTSTGTPDHWVRAIEEWRALGATHVGISTSGSGVDDHIACLHAVRQMLA